MQLYLVERKLIFNGFFLLKLLWNYISGVWIIRKNFKLVVLTKLQYEIINLFFVKEEL